MRMTDTQLAAIRTSAIKNFGRKTQVWLFGSRVDDSKKGGDIDLYIEPEIQDAAQLVDAKLSFLLELYKQIGEQKIDVVLRRSAVGETLPVYRIARETGVSVL
ncbi:MAG: nucleotidyltransferase domain-containing protein [Candidatus Competibacteraceae bacterium]|nr:nucleotidyltransferase domain-containing protein [Candidatus Competibacteraceae bacterium]